MPTVRTVPFPLCKTFPCVISRGDSSTLRWSSILFDAEMRQRQWRGCVSDTFSKNSITVSTWGLHCLSRRGNSVSLDRWLRRVGRVSRMHRIHRPLRTKAGRIHNGFKHRCTPERNGCTHRRISPNSALDRCSCGFIKVASSNWECSFASGRHLCLYQTRMSVLSFMGGLWAVLAGTDATACNPGDQCAVCESCKALICKVLR